MPLYFLSVEEGLELTTGDDAAVLAWREGEDTKKVSVGRQWRKEGGQNNAFRIKIAVRPSRGCCEGDKVDAGPRQGCRAGRRRIVFCAMMDLGERSGCYGMNGKCAVIEEGRWKQDAVVAAGSR